MCGKSPAVWQWNIGHSRPTTCNDTHHIISTDTMDAGCHTWKEDLNLYSKAMIKQQQQQHWRWYALKQTKLIWAPSENGECTHNWHFP